MVNDSLHIICGNCGQDLKELNMATWKYITAEIDEEYNEILNSAKVLIRCRNCATVHTLNKYIKEEK